MSLVYAHFCDDCGASSREPIDTCPRCNSSDITYAVAYAQVDWDDEKDAKRMDEIRSERIGEFAPVYGFSQSFLDQVEEDRKAFEAADRAERAICLTILPTGRNP